MDLQTGHLEDRDLTRIILLLLLLLFTMKLFCIFFFEYINPEAFIERCSLISRVLQGLVKICKKYMEINNFLQP